MAAYCSIPGCKSNSDKNPGRSFHRFPANKYIHDKWVENINNVFKIYKNKKYDKVCELHFYGGRKTLNERIPTIFNNLTVRTTVKSISENLGNNSSRHDETGNSSIEPVSSCVTLMETVPYEENSETSMVTALSSLQNSDHHNYTLEKKNTEYLNDVIASKDQIIDKLTSDVQNFKKIISELSNKNNLLKKELDRLQESKESSKREKKTKAQEMYDDILNDEKKLHYYTGFESLNSYNHLFNTLEDDFPKFKYYNMKQSDSPRYDRWLIIPFQIQYLLVLMRLRLNLGEQDLAYRFGISETTVTKYWKTWIRLLDNRLRQVNIFPMPEIVDEFRPLIFKEKGYDTVDGILVTTEIYLETPSSYRIQGETYSNYNHHNTVKGLVAFAPNGFLIFASELAPGRLSDKDLTIDSKILDTFRPGRSVIADPEFLIEEECAKKGLILNMLPFMNVRPQLSAGDESKSQSKEILRVHIERVISRLKCFRILNGVYPNSMHTELNCIWHICCRLVNWTNKPLLD